jgi:hypothetical protein
MSADPPACCSWPAGLDDGVLERDAAMQDFFKEIFA